MISTIFKLYINRQASVRSSGQETTSDMFRYQVSDDHIPPSGVVCDAPKIRDPSISPLTAFCRNSQSGLSLPQAQVLSITPTSRLEITNTINYHMKPQDSLEILNYLHQKLSSDLHIQIH